MIRSSALGSTIATVLLLSSGSLRASPAARAPADSAETPSAAVATLVAFGSTAAGYGLLVRGSNDSLTFVGGLMTIIGPSTGHFYAGEGAHAFATTGIRLVGVGLLVIGLNKGIYQEVSFDSAGGERDDDDTKYEIMALTGGALFVAATVYDLFDAHLAADRASARSLALTPTVHRSAGATVGGLAVVGSF